MILRTRAWGITVVLLVFLAAGLTRYIHGTGDDLSASYIGCRLVATGQVGHLYAHDPENFSAIGNDTAWSEAAALGKFSGVLHPYVQTPLWAYALQPLCSRTSFPAFNGIFVGLTLLCFAGCVLLIARFWAPGLFHPLAIGVCLLWLWCSVPFQYAMFLTQTHVIFLLMICSSLVLAERRQPLAAGLLLACATAVKITPGVFVVYWLLTRRWKAAASMAAWSAALWGATIFTAGPRLAAEYRATLNAVSHVLLVSQNNQSFAAWWMSRFYAPDEVFDYQVFPLPHAIQLVGIALMLGCTILGGLIDRRRASAPPIGAMMTLVAATIFAPIAWTHYFVILLGPLMILAQQSWRLRSWTLAGLALAIAALNLQPFAGDVQNGDIGSLALVRGHFLAGVLALIALAIAAWLGRSTASTTSPRPHALRS